MVKKIFLTLGSIFLFYKTYELIYWLINFTPNRFNVMGSLALSLVLNLFITGIFAFVGFAFLTSKMLPSSYYLVKQTKAILFLHKILGLTYFKSFLLKMYWGKESNRKRYFNGKAAGLKDFSTQTKQAEFGHLAAFVSILLVSIVLLYYKYVMIFIMSNIINILANLYPILLQRSHRIQIQRLEKLSKRKNDA